MTNVEETLIHIMSGETVSHEDRGAVITHVKTRIMNGEQGDDLPIAMEALGCDYALACDAVYAGKTKEALGLLESALMTKEQFLALQSELESLGLCLAKGEETDATESRIEEVYQLMNNSPWMLCPDEGCIQKVKEPKSTSMQM